MSRRSAARKPDLSQQAQMFAHIHDMVDELKDAYPAIEAQSKMKGGFSSSSIGVMGSGGFGDPTGEAVVEPRFDPSEPANDCLTLIDDLYASMKSVVGRARRLLPPPTDAQGEPGCRSCERLPKNWAPIHRGVRCKWCYEFWLAEGRDPSVEILIARSEGRRITDRMVKESRGQKAG